ncbi:hypothetical protein TESG_08294 [Trichophyton tonsurans CBS 112818]|uniref:Uncharacterized protein n=1 Tax=Trichophyton tonsurans (strain CBS 112818) TaxID=647933 RepID=F2RQV6_TRIT1|nr:hypothetical protein TESG_08294 [Trichophyton tonsurans CBS 112818]
MLVVVRQFGGEGHVAARRGGEEEEEADWTKQKGRRAEEEEEEEEEEEKKKTNAAKGVKQASQRGGSGRAAAETMQPLKARIRNTDTCTLPTLAGKSKDALVAFSGCR